MKKRKQDIGPKVVLSGRLTPNGVVRVIHVEYKPGEIDEDRLQRAVEWLIGGLEAVTELQDQGG